MLSYAIRRVLGAIPTLFIIITLAFFMMRLAPGGPFDGERRLPPEIERNIEAAYDLDKPLYAAILHLSRAARCRAISGRPSRSATSPSRELIAQGLPVSLRLGLLGDDARDGAGHDARRDRGAAGRTAPTDYSVMTLAMIGISIPTFVTAPLLQLVFGIYGINLFGLDLSLPVGGWNGGALRNMILPVIVLSLRADRRHRAADARQHGRGAALQLHPHRARQGLADLSHRHCATRCAPRCCRWSAISGPAIADIVTGSLIVEQIFGLPGIGRYFVQAALNRDYTLVMGVVIFYATLIISLNLVADLLYGVLDPRVRYD